jgi:zinc ribbon protein
MSGTTSDKPAGGKRDVAAPNSALGSASDPGASAPASASGSAGKSADATPLAQKNAQARVPAPPVAPAATSAQQRIMKCPKCGTDVREVTRFCQRCHHTMRYECPSCHNQQRTGGKCEKCGIDFLKYIGAVVTQKQAEADAIHDRLEQRTTLMKNILWLPFTLGYPIIRDYFIKRDRKK